MSDVQPEFEGVKPLNDRGSAQRLVLSLVEARLVPASLQI